MSKKSDWLMAMRYVAKTDKPKDPMEDPTPLIRRCRQMSIDDFNAFMNKYSELEKAWELRQAKDKPEAPKEKVQDPGIDEGTELVMQLMAEEWERVQRFEAAQGVVSKPPVPSVVVEGRGQEPA